MANQLLPNQDNILYSSEVDISVEAYLYARIFFYLSH